MSFIFKVLFLYCVLKSAQFALILTSLGCYSYLYLPYEKCNLGPQMDCFFVYHTHGLYFVDWTFILGF